MEDRICFAHKWNLSRTPRGQSQAPVSLCEVTSDAAVKKQPAQASTGGAGEGVTSSKPGVSGWRGRSTKWEMALCKDG